MNCDGISGLLSAYLDGELLPGDLLRVEQHLRRCHWCADEVDTLRQTVALVSSLDVVEMPASFHMQLHDRLVALGPSVTMTSAVPARRSRLATVRWSLPAAAAAAALVIGLVYSQQVGRLPGLTAKSLFAPQVAVSSAPHDSSPAGPVVAPTGAPVPPTSVAASGQPQAIESAGTSDPAPLGTPRANPTQAGIATPTPDPVSRPVDLTPQYHYQAVVALSVDQIAQLGASYMVEQQNGGSFVKIPTAQFDDALMAIAALPGAEQVGQSEQIDITTAIATARETAQSSKELLGKFQAQYDLKSPDEKADQLLQLEALKQAAANDQSELEKLEKQVQTSTIFLQVQGR